MSINSVKYHTCLAGYFYDKDLYLDEPDQKNPNTRKLVEQPYQQTRGELWENNSKTLCDVFFIEARAKAGLVDMQQKKPHIRKCTEQAFQHTKAQLWDEVTKPGIVTQGVAQQKISLERFRTL